MTLMELKLKIRKKYPDIKTLPLYTQLKAKKNNPAIEREEDAVPYLLRKWNGVEYFERFGRSK